MNQTADFLLNFGAFHAYTDSVGGRQVVGTSQLPAEAVENSISSELYMSSTTVSFFAS